MSTRQKLLILVLCLGLVGLSSGCVALLVGGGIGAGMAWSKKSVSQVTAINRERLLNLSLGMTKDQALNTMGKESFKNANWTEISENRKITRGMTITNPYRSEILQGKDKTLEVIYYVTDDKNNDGAIQDDELTPLVFDEGKLIGWGNSFLDANIQKHEIRLR